MTRGVDVREMIRVGAEWEAHSRDNPKDVLNVREGKRGGVGETGDGEEDNKDCLGRSGKVVDGAGFGEGIVRRESRDKRTRRGLEEGCPKRRGASGIGAKTESEVFSPLERVDVVDETLRFKLAERRDCDSARSRDKNERYSDMSRCGWRVK
jgi:hypothetical protein